MTQLDIANALATIVGLIGLFNSEGKATKDASNEEFVGWLEVRKHDELVRLIVEDSAISQAIHKLLENQNAQVMLALADLQKRLIEIATDRQSINQIQCALRRRTVDIPPESDLERLKNIPIRIALTAVNESEPQSLSAMIKELIDAIGWKLFCYGTGGPPCDLGITVTSGVEPLADGSSPSIARDALVAILKNSGLVVTAREAATSHNALEINVGGHPML